MGSYIVSTGAKRDLIEIWKYIAEDSVRGADALYERFYRAFALLASQPGTGVSSDDVVPNTRRFPVGKYLIYYRLTVRGLEILHVFHGRRDQRRIFRKSE